MSKRLAVLFCLSVPAAVSGRLLAGARRPSLCSGVIDGTVSPTNSSISTPAGATPRDLSMQVVGGENARKRKREEGGGGGEEEDATDAVEVRRSARKQRRREKLKNELADLLEPSFHHDRSDMTVKRAAAKQLEKITKIQEAEQRLSMLKLIYPNRFSEGGDIFTTELRIKLIENGINSLFCKLALEELDLDLSTEQRTYAVFILLKKLIRDEHIDQEAFKQLLYGTHPDHPDYSEDRFFKTLLIAVRGGQVVTINDVEYTVPRLSKKVRGGASQRAAAQADSSEQLERADFFDEEALEHWGSNLLKQVLGEASGQEHSFEAVDEVAAAASTSPNTTQFSSNAPTSTDSLVLPPPVNTVADDESSSSGLVTEISPTNGASSRVTEPNAATSTIPPRPLPLIRSFSGWNALMERRCAMEQVPFGWVAKWSSKNFRCYYHSEIHGKGLFLRDFKDESKYIPEMKKFDQNREHYDRFGWQLEWSRTKGRYYYYSPTTGRSYYCSSTGRLIGDGGEELEEGEIPEDEGAASLGNEGAEADGAGTGW